MSLAADTLSELGYEIECVSDGVAALRRLGAGPGVDLLFSDIMMPGGMNGIELAREARRVAPETKILLTSGYAQAALDAEGSLPQGIEILSKPYRQLDLTQRLRQLLEHRG
jgi:CheY-like chemotaxis protein